MDHFDWLSSFWFPYINFFLFMGILVYAARKPLRGLARQRKEEYEALYRAARQAQLKAEQKLAEINQRMQGLDKEVASIKQRAQAEAEAEAERLVAKGQELAEQMKREAARLAEGELLRAKEELRQEVVAAVRAQVEQKVREDFQTNDQLRYIQDKTASLKQIISRA